MGVVVTRNSIAEFKKKCETCQKRVLSDKETCAVCTEALDIIRALYEQDIPKCDICKHFGTNVCLQCSESELDKAELKFEI